MKTVFVAAAILTASFSGLAQGEASAASEQVLREAGPIANGELGYSHDQPASRASSRSRAATSTMGASAEASPQEVRPSRTKARAELDEAVYKGQLGSGEFGATPSRGSMGSQFIGQ